MTSIGFARAAITGDGTAVARIRAESSCVRETEMWAKAVKSTEIEVE